MESHSIQDLYKRITNCIIDQLEEGVFPWQKQWIESGLPKNYTTGEIYRGINLLFLASLHYNNSYFISENELKRIGGTVMEGTKIAHPRHYYVYNISQCKGIPQNTLQTSQSDPISKCRDIITLMPQKPPVHEGKETYYHPIKDFISISAEEKSKNDESYYVAFLHELVHCTGHSSRLRRKELFGTTPFGSSDTMEELIALIGTNYLVSYSGFKNSYFQNNELSIERWMEKLRANKLLIFYACYQAQKAVDFILHRKSSSSKVLVA
jgi:antirestriction protein ArdC